jgi:histo-blood group ABO system transferase
MPKEVDYGVTRFEARTMPFPHPTLRRYELFLEQKEYLNKFDYIFFLDIDMRIINIVGDEMLGKGLTAAQHPMYAIQEIFKAPYEKNKESTAYIETPPFYYAGGFQGGKTKDFIKAMEIMSKNIESDLSRNVIAKWNDESHWNRYLVDNPPSVVLSPSYIFPDSIIEEYYKKVWGCIYPPKIVCLTKPFSQTEEGQTKLSGIINSLK